MRLPYAPIMCLLTLLLFAACGDSSGAPTRLQLADLARFTDQYDGQRVSTVGIVRSHPDPEHYWIEDGDLNRVSVRPQSAIAERVGERVRVTGRFRYSRESGRAIEGALVEPAAD